MSTTEELYRSFPVKDWYELLRRKEDFSYYMNQPLERIKKDCISEIEELFQGVENNDEENIKEEISDVILMVQQYLIAILQKKNYKLEDSGKREKEKIYHRQPNLKENYKFDSREEETENFKLLKAKQHVD